MKDDLYNAVQNGEITANSPITVDIFSGPIGGYGFRSGNWPVTIGDLKFTMYASISHHLPLDEQRESLIGSVSARINRAIEGETYTDENGIHLKYTSQMTRILKDPAAVSLGRKGGQAKSDRKAGSSADNGKKGGRPKKQS